MEVNGKEIVHALESRYKLDINEFIVSVVKGKSLFEFIVGVLLSQNTSDRNAIRAFERLKHVLGSISPEIILETPDNVIEEAIKPAGMYRQRTIKIKELAKLFANKKYVNSLLLEIREADVEKARRILMSLPGIGQKSADVILLMYFGKPTFPVDTHILRITRRILGKEKVDYESARRFWMKFIDPDDYLKAHLLLILHGRTICKSRKPICTECVLKTMCQYYKLSS